MANLGLPEAELSILLVDDQQIREMNRRYLGHDKPTNILSFSMREGVNSSLNPHLLGDLMISIETARRQSRQWGLSAMEMITLLMIHGILHLLGYHHEGSRKEAREMALKQKLLFHRVTQPESFRSKKGKKGSYPKKTLKD
ncbi:MAG: rRNA maturation RNase YbeY [Thermodesulfobacteriota bacterium]